METTVTTLENGLRVATSEMPGAQSVSVNIFVAAGSRYEARRINGISHYLEHMLFKGTRRRPQAIIISEAIEGAGGRTNAFTSHEVICYLAKVPYEKVSLAQDILSDMVNDPLLAAEEVERERQVVIEEIRRTWDHPAAWAGELLYQAVFGDQPMGWAVAGTEESVRGISRQDLADYVETWYVPNNMVVSVAGNVRHDQVMELAVRYFQDRKPGELARYAPAGPRVASKPIIVETRQVTQANLNLAVRAPSRRDPDRYLLRVFSNLLGAGMSSRLFKEVRERRGLAYSVGCGTALYQDAGVLNASAGVSPEKVLEATRVIVGEFHKLVEEPVGEEELTKARDYSVGTFRLGLEDTMSVARWVGDELIATGQAQEVEGVVAKLRAVTAQDIQRMARRLFVDNELCASLTGPNDETEGLAEALAP
ncbi:MAG: insulinase family protein [Chloroflexi bacterium]|nr:insulinase family protein [Chloroflexota bacterium]